MMLAVSEGNRAVANLLASYRVPLSVPNNKGFTAYHMACARGDVELAHMLLS